MREFDVISVGDAVVDISIKIDRLPRSDDKVLGKKLSQQIGGTAANSACVCGSLGLRTAALSQVGYDSIGELIIGEYSKYGVDTRFVKKIEGYEPNQAIIFVDESGEKSLVFVESSGYDFPVSEISNAFKSASYVYTMPGNVDKFIALSSIAKQNNAKVVVDIEPTVIKNDNDLAKILEGASIAFFNLDGFITATGNPPSEQMLYELALQYDLLGVIVTRGSLGVVAHVDGLYETFCGFEVPVIDTTGAGDTFNAAFMYSIINTMPLHRALRFACAAAAISISAYGAKGCVPTVVEIEDFLKQLSKD
ncbi:carbohydrate kinase family protein [Vibrio mediterranei]|jgi:ribokinase/sulfofructose kinase|uniref:carbohydrate kinase family protein n=1 Tax=Vibrio mediterranei TaxID=689 RepID=UPI001EFE36F9|nr:carbohydrate kinase family protein [Vibrio mediterranei]MCG9627473.1 carbohydrate kinase family protein [Vibrio mediterranei]